MEIGFGFSRSQGPANQRSFDDSFGWSQTQSRESADQSDQSEDIRANAFWNSLPTITTNIDYPKFYDAMFNASSQQESSVSVSEQIARMRFDPQHVDPPEDDHDSNSAPLSPHSPHSHYIPQHSSSNQSSTPPSSNSNNSQSQFLTVPSEPYLLNVKHVEVSDEQLEASSPILPEQIFHQQLVMHLQQQQLQAQSGPLRRSPQNSGVSISQPVASTAMPQVSNQSVSGSPFNSLNLRIAIDPEDSSFTGLIDGDEKNRKDENAPEGSKAGGTSPGTQFRVNPWMKSKKDKQLTPTEFNAGSPTFVRRESPWNLSPNALKVHNPWKSKKAEKEKEKDKENPNTEKKKSSKEDLGSSDKKVKNSCMLLPFAARLILSDLLRGCQ